MAFHPYLCFTVAAGLSTLATPIVLGLAKAFGVVDLPNARKVHTKPTPRVGGVAFAFTTMLTFSLFWFFSLRHNASDAHTRLVAATMLGAGLMTIVGLADDVWGISSKLKLAALVAASLGFCAAGGNISSIVVDGMKLCDLGAASWPVTVLWIATITVSVAFIDGLDGLAAGIGLIAAATIAVCSAVGGFPVGIILGTALAGSLLGFLIFNYHPAKTFMGDSGSMFLGFMLATTMAMGTPAMGTTRALVIPGLVLSIPIFDLMFTMLRRGVLQRRSLFLAERGHIHHQLMDAGLCHLHAVIVLHLIALAGAVVGMVCLYCSYLTNAISIIAFCVGLWFLFQAAGSLQARSLVTAIRRNRAISRSMKLYQNAFYDLQLRFRQATSFDGWWQQVCHAADVLDFAKLDLPLIDREGEKKNLRWRRNGEPLAASNSITVEIPIPQRRTNEVVRAQVEVNLNDSLESGGQRIALFSRLMGEYGLDQLPAAPVKQSKYNPSANSKTPSGLPPGEFPHLRVALIHDFLYTYAGAERVLEQLIHVFPHADLFSLFDFLPADKRGFLQGKQSTPTFLQNMPFARKKHRAYLPLMPLAIEQLDVSQYDLVVSSSYIAAKGVITRPEQLHVCYCHTPVRFAWDLQTQYLTETGLTRGVRGMIAKIVLHYIRNWDVRSANGVDAFIANSNFVKRRIKKIYRRTADTIYPPVDTDSFKPGGPKKEFYLTASRLVPYKRMDLIVAAFAKMPSRELIVIGEGPELGKILSVAAGCSNIRVLGHQSHESLQRHMQQAKAFVFAAEEDFGIVPVEAQACGTPVIAFCRGGSAETVIDGLTGLHFKEQTKESIIDAVERFEQRDWDGEVIRANADRFSVQKFRKRIQDFVATEWERFSTPATLSVEIHPAARAAVKTIWRDVPGAGPKTALHEETE